MEKETTSGKTVPVLYKKHYSLDEYKKKIDPEIMKRLSEELKKLKEKKE